MEAQHQMARSVLDKLSDFFYHNDLLSKVVIEDDPYQRIIKVIRWYFSGFYTIRNNSQTKPYNPLVGEEYSCFWTHSNGSRTNYLAKKNSNDPPTCTLCVHNIQDGFKVGASIIDKSKFDEDSSFQKILYPLVFVEILSKNETYKITIPDGLFMIYNPIFAFRCKVNIQCMQSPFSAHLEFKLSSCSSSSSCFPDLKNFVSGQLNFDKETLSTLEGCWDKQIYLTEIKTGRREVLWELTEEVKNSRLQRYPVSSDELGQGESEELMNSASVSFQNKHQNRRNLMENQYLHQRFKLEDPDKNITQIGNEDSSCNTEEKPATEENERQSCFNFKKKI